jgi:hypothetical protein
VDVPKLWVWFAIATLFSVSSPGLISTAATPTPGAGLAELMVNSHGASDQTARSLAEHTTVYTGPLGAGVPSRGSPTHHVGVVNPLRYERNEPAPMGVADYGVTGAGQSYNYTTDEVVGTAQIDGLDASASTGAGRLLGIQLNAVLSLGPSAHSYTYWVRFAPWVNSSTDVLTLQNEVFNLSSTSTSNPSPISGRGSINFAEADQYQYTPPCTPSYPGNCAALSLPATLGLEAESGDPGGVPSLTISYSLGGAWYSEDAISFPSLAGLPDRGFVVNGSAYTPVGNFFDAELSLGGPYAGYVQTNRGSSVRLSLEEWNGHNLQAVPNAWDFGADSSNSIQNASVSASSVNGLPADEVGTGSGSLGPLYSATNESQVTIIGIPTNGTLRVNGTWLNYTGGEAVVELTPGPCPIDLLANGTVLASATEQFTKGEVVTVSLHAFHSVEIDESGLPNGTRWSVDWGGDTQYSSNSSIQVLALNGTHELQVGAVSGFLCNVSAEAVVVQGPEIVGLNWSPFLFPVSFGESGLPAGTSWWVSLAGSTVRGSSPTLNLSAGNGTFAYSVGGPYRFLPLASIGNVTIADSPASVLVQFVDRASFIAGTVRPDQVSIDIDGSSNLVSNGTFNVTVEPGPHSLRVTAQGYVPWEGNVTTTAGNTTELTLTLNTSSAAGGAAGSGTDLSGLFVASTVIAVVGAAALLALVGWRRGRSR